MDGNMITWANLAIMCSATIEATSFPGYPNIDLGQYSDHFIARTTATSSTPATIYTTGETIFNYKRSYSGKNNALAYVLAECASNIGIPRASYVNVAFWQAKDHQNATSGNLSSSFFNNDQNASQEYARQMEILAELRAELARLEDNVGLSLDELRQEYVEVFNEAVPSGISTSELRMRIINELRTRINNLNSSVSQSNTYIARSASDLWQEATTFGSMWRAINDNYNGRYENSVIDRTHLESVTVEYNGENQTYKIGPFNISYLEFYVNGLQLCGMTGVPVLTVRRDGRQETLRYGNNLNQADWRIIFEGNRNTSNYPSTYNLYPHSGENFYIEMNYQEGIEQISGVRFFFRYLEAEGSYDLYEGNMRIQEWEASFVVDTCEENTYTCEHNRYLPHDYDDEDGVTHHCSGGRVCSHGWRGSEGHIISVSLHIETHDLGDTTQDIQDVAYCPGASRRYVGVSYGESISSQTLVEIETGRQNSIPSHGFNWQIDLTTTMAGDVWVDADAQKTNNVVDGIKDDNNSGIANIAVTVYLYKGITKQGKAIAHKADGTRIQWPVYTDKNGHYEISRLEAPGITGMNKCFYVAEFEYDGQVYNHTIYLGESGNVTNDAAKEGTAAGYTNSPNSYINSSVAVEEVDDRYKFDQTFGEITGNEAIKSDLSTAGITKTTNENGENAKANSDSKFNVLKYNGENGEYIVDSTLDSAATDKGMNPGRVTSGSGYERYRMVASTYYDNTDTHGVLTNSQRNNYRIEYPIKEKDSNGNPTVWEWRLNRRIDTVNNRRYISEYMLHVNLGLKERPTSDISLLEDLYKVTVVVNEQKLTKQYDSTAGYSSDNDLDTFLISLETQRRRDGTYTLGLYNADYSYKSQTRYKNAIQQVKDIKKGTELRVFATYVTRVYNNSETNSVEINELTDYYDENFTLVADDVNSSIVNEALIRNQEIIAEKPYYRIISTGKTADWGATKADNQEGYDGRTGDFSWNDEKEKVNGMIVSKTNNFSEIKLAAGEYIEIFTTYEIDQDGYDKMTKNESETVRDNKLTGDKYNIAEISSYSTYYSVNDEKDYYVPYKTGWVSGRVDRDSAPNNIDTNDLKDRSKYEDDTYLAKTLRVELETYERDMYGYVFEDIKTKDRDYSIKVGDGKYDPEEEALIENVEVSMYEVINLGKFNSDGSYNTAYDSFDYYYKVPEEYYNYNYDTTKSSEPQPVLTSSEKVKIKDKDGNENEIDGNYYLSGFLAGDYVLRFDYGKNADSKDVIYTIDDKGNNIKNEDVDVIKYNGQDYENTAFLIDKDESLNTKYLDLRGKDNGGEIDLTQNYSIARDNESRRMVVDAYSRTIENDRAQILRDRKADDTEFVDATRMFAETPIMQVEVRDPKVLQQEEAEKDYNEKYEEDAYQIKNYKYSISNINFGLEERAKTDIALEKYITSISLWKAGERVFYASINDEGEVEKTAEGSAGLDKLTYLSHEKANTNGLVQQGFYAVSVEDDYWNDLTLSMQYKIRTINNSEVDFTGKLSNYYRAEDIIKAASKTPTSREYDNIIADLKNEAIEKDNGIGTNATLKEIFLATDDSSNLKNLLNGNKSDDDSIRPQVIAYGMYVGRFYYQNKIDKNPKTYYVNDYDQNGVEPAELKYSGDKVVRTTVDQIVDYVDIDARFAEDSLSVDGYWSTVATDKDDNGYITGLNGLITKEVYREVDGVVSIYDDKKREYITDNRSNIVISYNENLQGLTKYREVENGESYLDKDYSTKGRVEYKNSNTISFYNPKATVELVPKDYDNGSGSQAEIMITIQKTAASGTDANQMKIDNLAEVLVYSNSTGRRDVNSVPGNAMGIGSVEGLWNAGYNSVEDKDNYNPDWTTVPENDAYSPEYVTVIAPTGIAMRTYIKNYIMPMAIMGTIIIALFAIFGIKQIRIKKLYAEDSTDDEE